MSTRINVLAALLASALPTPLLAQDLTPTGERILSDPTYLPYQAQVYGASSFQFTTFNKRKRLFADHRKFGARIRQSRKLRP